MFRTWFFTEMSYPYTPPAEMYRGVKNDLPNRWFDPDTGYEQYHKFLDLYRTADELGLDVMVNEHHQTATCLNSVMPLTMAIIARETKRARILALGNPLANRADPVRVAEEMAMIDVLSGGRAEVGFVRGVPQEVSATNYNPVGMKERMWEAADLIEQAFTHHDGPFNFEGKYFHHRMVNIWPRPYQQPHPPFWMPTLSASSARDVADRDYTIATIFNGKRLAKEIFKVYRDRYVELGRGQPPVEKLAYCGMVHVGETDAEALAFARKQQWFFSHMKVPTNFLDVPGYLDVPTRTRVLKLYSEGKTLGLSAGPGVPTSREMAEGPVEDLIEEGYFFAGSPDTIVDQILSFNDAVGGFGNLLAMMQTYTMPKEHTTRSMRLLAEEVLPRLRAKITPTNAVAAPVPV